MQTNPSCSNRAMFGARSLVRSSAVHATILLALAAVLPVLSGAEAVAKGRSVGSVSSGRNALMVDVERGSSAWGDLPVRVPAAGGRADTSASGYVQTIGGRLYAVPGEIWTFEHGAGGPEGWYAVDLSVLSITPGRPISAAAWDGHGNLVAAPLISGEASSPSG